jgi:hypothetical protein
MLFSLKKLPDASRRKEAAAQNQQTAFYENWRRMTSPSRQRPGDPLPRRIFSPNMPF